jgi:6-pyruvoyltetrahydropterin/6-carboxytetrahydropterin synthase
MYTIKKTFHFSASHVLNGLHEGHQCGRLHGHNYQVEIVLRSQVLNGPGFVVDYGELKAFKAMVDGYDHRHLNDLMECNPTAENLARALYNEAKLLWPETCAVRVSETPATWAEFSE